MKYAFFIMILVIGVSCTRDSNSIPHFQLKYFGALKNIMHQNDIKAKVDLKDFQNELHFYALGALEDLKGEILIIDSQPYISSVENEDLRINDTFNHKATLFVSANISKWQSFEIPNSLKDDSLEEFIEDIANDNGIDTSKPFPFLINGIARSLDWHVIDWKNGDLDHTHENHINSGLKGTLKNREVEILGFYSNKHHAIFTHHTTNMHMHFKTFDNAICGHLDKLVIGSDMKLKIPIAE